MKVNYELLEQILYILYLFSGIVTLIVVYINSCISKKTLEEMRITRLEETKPYIIIYITKEHVDDHYMYLTIENIGKTGAYNIFIEPTITYLDAKQQKYEMKSNFSFMAPRQKIQSLVPFKFNDSISIDGLVSYYDSNNKKYETPFTIDFSTYSKMSYIMSPISEISNSLKEISSKIK